jgi:hypothetical protein
VPILGVGTQGVVEMDPGRRSGACMTIGGDSPRWKKLEYHFDGLTRKRRFDLADLAM